MNHHEFSSLQKKVIQSLESIQTRINAVDYKTFLEVVGHYCKEDDPHHVALIHLLWICPESNNSLLK